MRVRAAAAALALAAGCARVPPPDLSQDPTRLLEQVRAAQGAVTACQGSARLRLSSPDLSGSLDAWAAAGKGGRLRVEVFDFFGNPAAVLVAGGGRFALLDAREGTVYRGEDTPENLARLLPVPLGARELAQVICGGAPLIDGGAVLAEAGDGVLLLEIAGPSGREVLAVAEGGAVERASFLPGAGGGTPWKASFSEFRGPVGSRVATHVELRGGGAELALTWKDDLEVNPPLESSLFELETPRGARVIDLVAGTRFPRVDLPIRPAPTSKP